MLRGKRHFLLLLAGFFYVQFIFFGNTSLAELSTQPIVGADKAGESIIYISPEGNNTDGLSWATAYTDPVVGITAAIDAGATVWVGEGEYYFSEVITLPTGFSIYGGFPLEDNIVFEDRDPIQFTSIFDGQDTVGGAFILDDIDNIHIEGLQFTRFIGNGSGYSAGGAIRILENSQYVTIESCSFIENNVNSQGAGINAYFSDVDIINCEFISNSGYEGSAFKAHVGTISLIRCLFQGNTATHHGVATCYDSDVTVNGCIFAKNSGEQGAGFEAHEGGIVQITNSVFDDNESSLSAGAVRIYSHNTVEIANCVFIENYAEESGGAVRFDSCQNPPYLTNSIFINNNKTAIFENTPAAEPYYLNNLFYGNESGLLLTNTSELYVSAETLNALGDRAENNIEGDPLFALAIGDYHLRATSPCIDAGISNTAPVTDIDGEARVEAPDIGIDEFVDSDGDDLADQWENANGTDPDTPDAEADPDDDGLTNAQEAEAGTGPQDDDSDDDGLKDGIEVDNGLDPLRDDAEEDADSDGVSNAVEVEYGFDPKDPESTPVAASLVVEQSTVSLSEAVPQSSVTISNGGVFPLSWTATVDNEAITVTPASGEGPGEVTVTATDFGTDISATLTITNMNNAEDTIQVSVSVIHTPLPSDLDATPLQISLSEGTPSTDVTVSNLGELPLQWTASSDNELVSVAPVSGEGAGTVVVSATDFSADSSATVTITNVDNAEDVVQITVSVVHTPLPSDLDVSPLQITLNVSTPSADVAVSNLGELPLQWTASSNNEAVTISPESGEGTTTVTLSTTDFTEAQTAQVTFTNTNNSEDTAVVVITIEQQVLADLCEDSALVTSEWSGFQATFLDSDDINADGLPEAAVLALMTTVACWDDDSALWAATLNAYAINYAVLEVEAPAALADFMHATAAALAMGGTAADAILVALQDADIILRGTYESVDCDVTGLCMPSAEKDVPLEEGYLVFTEAKQVIPVPYSGAGDLDGDGVSNATEYANAAQWEATTAEFVAAALDSSLDGTEPHGEVEKPGGPTCNAGNGNTHGGPGAWLLLIVVMTALSLFSRRRTTH